MKFDSKSLKERLVPNLEKGVSMAEKCDELIQDIARNASDVQISFNGSKCTTLIEEAKKYTNDICIATKVTVSMFDSAEKANMEIIDRLYSLDGDYFEEIFGTESYYYGTGQNIYTHLVVHDFNSGEQGKTIEEVAKIYNMTYEDAAKACTILDSIGACSYAATANEILMAYRYDPAAFEEDFGYPMFDFDEDGNLVVNSDRLLMDMYIYYNSEENGGKIFKKASNGKLEVNDEYVEVVNEETDNYSLKSGNDQVRPTSYIKKDPKTNTFYMSIAGIEFLESKKSSKRITVEQVIYGNESTVVSDLRYMNNKMTDETKEQFNCVDKKEELKKTLKDNIDENHVVYMTVNHKETTYHRTDGERDYTDTLSTSDHAVYVTGVTDEGILVSTWGEEYLITYDNLIESQEYEIYICTVEDK
ncbi:MAG: hypothetical protein IKE91_02970 [Clostridia bacterium]|nr:hypothetical protein [Clostridia bacterium]